MCRVPFFKANGRKIADVCNIVINTEMLKKPTVKRSCCRGLEAASLKQTQQMTAFALITHPKRTFKHTNGSKRNS